VDCVPWRVALIGALVAALGTLPGLGAGTLWDNSETTYGEVAREILIGHDWIVMHLDGDPWFVQPPLYFWIAASFAQLLGVTEFAVRLPSALATIATSAVLGYAVARVANPRAGLFASVVLSSALMQAVVGRLAIMDALLDCGVAIAILGCFGALATGSRRAWYAAWVALGLATLAKGPVAPVAVLLVIGPWMLWEWRSQRRLAAPGALDWFGGIASFAAIVLPWTIALAHAAGFAALGELFGHYTFGRYVGTIENQGGPIWYYVPVLVLGFFPWFAFLIPASLEAGRAAEADAEGSLWRLALAWTIVPFAFFSLANTKLPNYIALELPGPAILVALWFDGVAERDDRRAALAWSALVPITIGLLAFGVAIFSSTNRLSADLAPLRLDLALLGLVMFVGSAVCFGLLLARASAWLAPFALGAASLGALSIGALVVEPAVERFKPIPQLAAIIERERRPGDVVGIQSVSGGQALTFYTQPVVAHLDGPFEQPPGAASDPRRLVCSAARAFVVSKTVWAKPYPTYGRTRRVLAVSNQDVLYLFDGPPCNGSD
jgi:4-amino-4-deoxy-L-arabinose transferase-like glycosyltransferase